MLITKEWLKSHNACKSGITWFCEQEIKETDADNLIRKLYLEKRYDWANWLNREIRGGFTAFPMAQEERPSDFTGAQMAEARCPSYGSWRTEL